MLELAWLLAEDAVAGAQQGARQLVADAGLRHLCGGDCGLQVDVDMDSAVPQQVDEILGGDVAACTRRERAATEPPDRGVQSGDTGAHSRVRTGQAGPASVVEVRAQWDFADQRADPGDQIADPARW